MTDRQIPRNHALEIISGFAKAAIWFAVLFLVYVVIDTIG